MPQPFSITELKARAAEVWDERDPRSPVEQFKYQKRHFFVSARGVSACVCSACQQYPAVL